MDRQTDSLWAVDGDICSTIAKEQWKPSSMGTTLFLVLASYPVLHVHFTLATCKSLMRVICGVEGW